MTNLHRIHAARRAARGRWPRFARRHRVAAGHVCSSPSSRWLVPFKALAINILIYGLFALGFNLLFGYPACCRSATRRCSASAPTAAASPIVHFGWPWYAAIVLGVRRSRAAWRLVIGLLGDPHPRHLLRDGDDGAVAMRLLPLLPGGRTGPAARTGCAASTCATIDLFGLQLNFLDPLTRYYVIAGVRRSRLCACCRASWRRRSARCIEAVRENEARAAGLAATTSSARG